MRRKKQEVVHEDIIPQGPPPYELGLNETVADFYAAVRAAEEDIEAKRAAAKKSEEKYMRTFRDGGEKGHQQYLADQKALGIARDVPDQIRKEFLRGACDAFLENPPRPDNLQHILSNPEKFLAKDKSEDRFVIGTLVTLLRQSANPDTVFDRSLAKVTADRKQEILDRTLMSLVCDYRDIEGPVSILLKAGAKGLGGLSVVLAHAFHLEHPDAITDMLIAKGATIEGALERMHAYPDYYGDAPKKVADFEYRRKTDARILDLELKLEAATRELTDRKPGKPEAAASAPPAPAQAAAPRRLKL
jgi:hypothetical protein